MDTAAVTAHAIARAKERYGIDLTPADITWVTHAIRDGRSVRLAILTRGRERHLVDIGGTALIVVCAMPHVAIVTILPKNARVSRKTHGYSKRLRRH